PTSSATPGMSCTSWPCAASRGLLWPSARPCGQRPVLWPDTVSPLSHAVADGGMEGPGAPGTAQGPTALPTIGQQTPLLLPLPPEYHTAILLRAELTCRADHFELCLILATKGAGASQNLPGAAGGVSGYTSSGRA